MNWLTELKQNESFKDSLKSNNSYSTASSESFSNKLQSNLSNNEEKEVKLMNLDDFFRGIGVNIDENNDVSEAINPKPTDETMNSLLEFSTSVDVSINAKPESYYLDTSSYNFAEKELKIQPMNRKSRKQLTPEEQKDARYWDKRAKNNFAAKRSRETRRMRENQIVMRANFLEKENGTLKKVIKKLKDENDELKKILNH